MKYAIEPIKIAPRVWLGVDEDDGWRLFLGRYVTRTGEWRMCKPMFYALDFAALVLRSTEAIEIAIVARLDEYGPPVWEFNDRAAQKLIDRANELWTFKVAK